MTRIPNSLLKTAWALAMPLALFLPNAARAGGYALTTLHSFDNSGNAEGGLTLDVAGNLYGVTTSGGPYGGSVFRVDGRTGEYATVAEFTSETGGISGAGVTLDAAGNIYGTTGYGGPGGYGGVFKIDAQTGAIGQLASFEQTFGSGYPTGVTLDAAGNIYGSTGRKLMDGGDPLRFGSVYKIDAATGEYSTLVVFDEDDGIAPISQLALDAAGNFYGTAGAGGPGGIAYGTVFKIDGSTGDLSTLAAFGPDGDPRGRSPWSGVVLDAAGNIYGTIDSGDTAFTQGSVFKIDAATGDLSILATFDGLNSFPSGLALDAAGNLYGTTQAGGDYDQGRVYKIDASTGVLSTLYSFNGDDGANPVVGVVVDAAGAIYGRTYQGGEHGHGTIFRLALDDGPPAAVPEPTSLVMLGLGAGALALVARRKRS